MATKKVSNKASGSKKSKTLEPTRIIIEIVIRNETNRVLPNIRKNLIEAFAEDEAQAPNFSFSFQNQGITITSFVVEGHSLDFPPLNGSFFTPIFDPIQIRVTVVAKQDIPGQGNGSLSLLYKGKNVYSPAKEIPFSGVAGGFTELVNLP